MKRLWYLIFLLSSCGLFKDTIKSRSHELFVQDYKSELKNQQNWIMEAGSFTLYRDSVKRDFAVQLWPKGVFSFSAEHGFLGQADSLIILGSMKEERSFEELTRLKESDRSLLETKTSKEEKSIVNQKHVAEKSLRPWLYVVILITAIIIILFFRKFKLFN